MGSLHSSIARKRSARGDRLASTCSLRSAVLISLTLALGGCATVPAYKQGLLSKSNMAIGSEADDPLAISSLSQIETGSDASASGPSAGCIACK